MAKKLKRITMQHNIITTDKSSRALLQEIRGLVERAKERVYSTANSELVSLNWHIGKLIKTEIIKSPRAEYGNEIVATLSQQLQIEFGRGFTITALFRMIKFYEVFQEEEIVATLWQQLGWSHFRILISIADPLKREFYAEICKLERWSVRTLQDKVQSMLFERTTISKKTRDYY